MEKDEERIKLEEGLEGMNKGSALLVVSSSKDLQSNIATAVEYMVERKNLNCIYICLNKPHSVVEQVLKERGLSKRKMFFIDCSTALVTTTLPRPGKNLSYVSTPADLTGIGVTVKKIDPPTLRKGFIVIDALRTLSVYNSPGAIAGFIKMLTSFAAIQGTRIVAFTTTVHDPLFEKVAPFFKHMVELEYRP